jgi:hypothetical protein
MGDQVRIAVVGDERGKGVDQAKTLVGARQQQDATIGTDLAGVEGVFFLPILGSANGKRVSSASVGMADSVRAARVASAPNLYAILDTCTMPASESLLCGELDGLGLPQPQAKDHAHRQRRGDRQSRVDLMSVSCPG